MTLEGQSCFLNLKIISIKQLTIESPSALFSSRQCRHQHCMSLVRITIISSSLLIEQPFFPRPNDNDEDEEVNSVEDYQLLARGVVNQDRFGISGCYPLLPFLHQQEITASAFCLSSGSASRGSAKESSRQDLLNELSRQNINASVHPRQSRVVGRSFPAKRYLH